MRIWDPYNWDKLFWFISNIKNFPRPKKKLSLSLIVLVIFMKVNTQPSHTALLSDFSLWLKVLLRLPFCDVSYHRESLIPPNFQSWKMKIKSVFCWHWQTHTGCYVFLWIQNTYFSDSISIEYKKRVLGKGLTRRVWHWLPGNFSQLDGRHW